MARKIKPAEEMNLQEKLAGISKMVEVINKNKSGYNYKYVSEDEILARVTAGMDKYHVRLSLRIVPGTMQVTPYSYTKVKSTKNGGKIEEVVNEILVQADMVYTWTNTDNPEEKEEAPWHLVGSQSDASQAFGSALSYSNRYFFLKYFHIATPDDDPDNWRSKKQLAAEQENIEILNSITSEIGVAVNSYLDAIKDEAERKKNRTELLAIVKKYEKSGNYNRIKDVNTASDLLEAINVYIGGKQK